jgi:DHA1 family bicyclomycin/chloramphenicol resistance-like MFS transporter
MASRLLPPILASLSLLGPFAIHLFFPLIPVLKGVFGLTNAQAQLAFTAGVLGMAFSTLVYGSAADRYGSRPVLLVGLALFLIGSALSALAPTFLLLLAGRAIQSIGAGCGITLARAIARDVYGPERLVQSIAYLTMFFAMGGLLAPGVGGFLVDQVGWRAVFGLASTAGTLMLIGAYVIVPGRGAAVHLNSGHSLASSFLELLGKPRFCALIAQTACSTGTFMVLATASSILMKEALHRPATEFGLYFSVVPLGFVSGSIISSWVGNRASVEQMIILAASIAVAASAAQATLLLSGHLTPLVLFVPGTFITLAQGLSLPFAQAGAMATIPRLAGTAAGIGVFAQNFFGAGFAQLYGLLSDGTPVPMVEIMATTVGLGFVAASVAWLLKEPDRIAGAGNR